ncbi:hypothetical protein [Fodinibius saliphilus]|uniref:hypothetical protein n=1 Tax=Fodinibius saliphilus TaxID=1920650 RepID=UPI0011099B42|nr:hypothetical protein [Fodinibius saliphilus]
MFKRSIKLGIAWSLVAFVALGLTISTLHSHHELQWDHHHPEDTTDTGNCISQDESHCPICGIFLKSNLPNPSSGDLAFFFSREFKITVDLISHSVFEIVNKGRSPPLTG